MKKILVATDFSPAAMNAAEYAAEMALYISSDIHLLNVFDLPQNYGDTPTIINPEDLRKEAEKDIRAQREQLIRKTNDKVNITTEVRMGALSNELETICERINPYAVVMGSQGKTAAERIFIGSNTVHEVKHLNWPLLAVPRSVSFSGIKKIGLACDFDNVLDEFPIEEIKLLVNDFKAELNVLNIRKQKEVDQEVKLESGILKKMLANLNPRYHFIANKNIDECILGFAEKHHLDLLIVLPKRHSLLESLVHKSHSKQFVLHSMVPVMAIHE